MEGSHSYGPPHFSSPVCPLEGSLSRLWNWHKLTKCPMRVESRIGQVRPSITQLLWFTSELLPVHQGTLVTFFKHYICLGFFTCETQIMEVISFIEIAIGNLPAHCLATQESIHAFSSPKVVTWGTVWVPVSSWKHTCFLIMKINNKYKCCRFSKEREMYRSHSMDKTIRDFRASWLLSLEVIRRRWAFTPQGLGRASLVGGDTSTYRKHDRAPNTLGKGWNVLGCNVWGVWPRVILISINILFHRYLTIIEHMCFCFICT